MTAGSGTPPKADHEFLAGGGEMGERIRSFDWSKTPLGPPGTWPQSLRSCVSILLPSKAQIILFWGPELVTLYNDPYRPVFGAKHPAALGVPARDAWREIWETRLKHLFGGVLETGEAFWGKDLHFILERNGFPEETFFDVSYDPVRDETGKVGGIFCIVSETTGRVMGERRLALLNDLAARNATARTARDACALAMETLAANPQDVPFALAFLDGELQACTPGAEAALASAKGELVKGLPIASSIPGCEAGKLLVGVNPQRPFDEQYRSFLDLVAGQLATAIANAQAHEEERKRAEALAEIDRAKTAFFSNVSHEFRTPLTLMLGPVEDLLAKSQDAVLTEDRAQLMLVQRNGLRLLKLVNTLLDFSRIEAGRVQATYEPVDLAVLTAELASNFRSACERAGVELVVSCPPDAEPVYVDREMWEKIVLNLVSNAFKFTFEGRITVSLEQRTDSVALVVSDTGTGIPQEELPRMFERFHRIAGARGRTHEGTGIGLALVQELVQLHGGAIEVESAPGRGTAFTVTVPLGAAHLPADRVNAARARQTAFRGDAFVKEALQWLPGDAATGAADSQDMPRQRVLLADDNADLREYVARLLGEHYEVEAVGDGEAALAAAHARRPDLIVADIMMPRLDGFGLIHELRASPGLRDVPVVVLSARAGEEARMEGLSGGADDYLVKPFSARELMVRVGALLRSADFRRQALDRDRRAAEQLRRSEQELSDFFETAAIALHWVGPDGFILRVNQAELDLLGCRREEYVGRHIAEFHVDRGVIDDILARLRRGETLRDCPAQLRRKDGSIRDVLINASALFENGRFIHTRCFTHDVTERKNAERTQARLAAIVESSDDAIISKDLNSIIMSWNAGAQRLYGYTADEAIGQPITMLMLPDQVNEEPGILARIRRGETIDHYETVRRRKDGSLVDLSLTVSPISDEQGRVVGASKIARDITERKRAEEAVRLSEALLQVELADARLLHTISMDLIQEDDVEALYSRIMDAAAAIMRSDFASLQMLYPERGSAGELRLLAFRGFDPQAARFWEWVRADSQCTCGAALRTGGRVVAPDVEKADFMAGTRDLATYRQTGIRAVQSTPLLSRSGKLVGMISTHWREPHEPSERDLRLLDILARQAADLIERRAAEEALREADRRKDEFLATLSHELRNPLAPIRNAVELLASGDGNPELAAHVRGILSRQVGSLVRLVDDLLELSRISRGSIVLQKEQVDLAEVVANAIETSRPIIEAAGHALEINLPQQPIVLDADPVRMAQVLTNLLNNAAKYTARGGRISLTVQPGEQVVAVSVRDSGIGIAPEMLPRVFDMFVQASDGAGQGLGIGLSLARSLVRMHGGSIEGRSEGLGRGSEFTVRLPLATSRVVPLTSADETAAAGLRRAAL